MFEDIRIADFSWWVAGPILVRYFSDFGAKVVHVESRSFVDLMRTTSPFKDGKQGLNRSGWHSQLHTSQYSFGINLNTEAGQKIAKQLVCWADIVVENFAPGVMKKWGLDYEQLAMMRPDIIMLSISNAGQTGPRSSQRAGGAALHSLVGLTSVLGWPDRGPANPFGAMPDHISARFGVCALVKALEHRNRTGEGEYIDLSMFESTLQLLSPSIIDYLVNGHLVTRAANESPCMSPHNVYQCKGEDSWCAIAISSEQDWRKLCEVMRQPELTKNPLFHNFKARKKNEQELDVLVNHWTANHTKEEVANILQDSGIAAMPVYEPKELLENEQLKERAHFDTVPHPEIGDHRIQSRGFTFSKSRAKIQRAPLLGEHNEFVARDILGMTVADYDSLVAQGVFETSE